MRHHIRGKLYNQSSCDQMLKTRHRIYPTSLQHALADENTEAKFLFFHIRKIISRQKL